MYLSYCPYWYALGSMLEECLFSTERSRKGRWVSGGGFIRLASTSRQQRSPVCAGCTGRRKTSENQVPEEYFFLRSSWGTHWLHKQAWCEPLIHLNEKLEQIKSASAFQYCAERRRKGKAVPGGSQDFTVNVEFCCQLTQICTRAIMYPPAEVWEGVSGREALIFVFYIYFFFSWTWSQKNCFILSE